MANLYCPKCQRTLRDTEFFTYKDGTKCELCKSCLTLQVNNDNPDSFIWILEKFDVPWIPQEWKPLRDKAFSQYQQNPKKYPINGLSVIGKYIGKLKLTQYKWKSADLPPGDDRVGKHWCYADTDAIQELYQRKEEEGGSQEDRRQLKLAEMEEAYNRGEISEHEWMTYKEIETPKPAYEEFGMAATQSYNGPGGIFPANDSPFVQVDIPDIGAELTEEDKIYLALKWGRLYSAADWVALEQMYLDYEESFGLGSADLVAGTKQLCKLDLKGNQALDTGDYDSYSKLSKASDALRKSLKFTEAQRKENKEEEFDCICKIAAFVEEYNDEDFIHPIDLSVDRDIVDKDMRDMKNFTKSLVEEDPAIYKLIEQYIKKREAENMKEVEILTDDDLKEYADAEELQLDEDNEIFEEVSDDEFTGNP